MSHPLHRSRIDRRRQTGDSNISKSWKGFIWVVRRDGKSPLISRAVRPVYRLGRMDIQGGGRFTLGSLWIKERGVDFHGLFGCGQVKTNVGGDTVDPCLTESGYPQQVVRSTVRTVAPAILYDPLRQHQSDAGERFQYCLVDLIDRYTRRWRCWRDLVSQGDRLRLGPESQRRRRQNGEGDKCASGENRPKEGKARGVRRHGAVSGSRF